MWEFPDMAAFAAWYAHMDTQQLLRELREYVTDLDVEL